MHTMFLQSVEVAQYAGWMHLPVRSLEKGGNILGTVLSLNLGKILRYMYINI